MFRLLLIISIVGYVIYKVGGLFFRAGAASQHRANVRRNIHVDPTPKKDKKSNAIKGGDYVDYEEVK